MESRAAKLISVVEAHRIIDEQVSPAPAVGMPLATAYGCVLRREFSSPEDLPPFDRSSVDGYVVLQDDPAENFRLVGEIRAGQRIDHQLRAGETMRILTGARLPCAGTRAVMQEHVSVTGDQVRIVKRSAASNVRLKGEDAPRGQMLLPPGHRLDAAALALLSSLGQEMVEVSPKPRLLHLTTGDEIVPAGVQPEPGQIRDANGPLLRGLLLDFGVGEIVQIHAPDDLAVMRQQLEEVRAKDFDVVLISGGSGGGDYDFTGQLLQDLGGTVHIGSINVRPGKPLLFATAGQRMLFGLPGNVLSHYVCFHLFVRRALERWQGMESRPCVTARMEEAIPDPMNNRETWWPAHLRLVGEQLGVRAIAWKSSGDITRLPGANALIKVPASTAELPWDSVVTVLITSSI